MAGQSYHSLGTFGDSTIVGAFIVWVRYIYTTISRKIMTVCTSIFNPKCHYISGQSGMYTRGRAYFKRGVSETPFVFIACLQVPSQWIIACLQVPRQWIIACLQAPSQWTTACLQVPSQWIIACLQVPIQWMHSQASPPSRTDVNPRAKN